MDSYLSNLRDKESYLSPAKKKPVVEETPVDYESYSDEPKKGFLGKFLVWSKKEPLEEKEYNEDDFSEEPAKEPIKVQKISNDVDKYEALEKEERAIEKEKDSLFARLFKRKKYVSAKESDFSDGIEVYNTKKDSEEVALLKNDLKKLGVICYDLIKTLDEPEFKRFKLSDNFTEYKTILKKHNLVRTKY